MRQYPTIIMERCRVLKGPYASTMKDGCNGAFMVHIKQHRLKVLSSDGTDDEAQGWEHVSVSCPNRTPTWLEMCWIKEQMWEDEEIVFQLHPKTVSYTHLTLPTSDLV